MQKRISYKNVFSDIWNFENFGNLEIFFNIFFLFLQKNSPQISKFSKNRNIVLENPLNNIFTKFQVILFINDVFIAFWMWKMTTFGRNTM